jgi:hypothetical protein
VGNDTNDTISGLDAGPTIVVRWVTATHNKYAMNAWMTIETKTATTKNRDGSPADIGCLKGNNCGHVFWAVYTAIT